MSVSKDIEKTKKLITELTNVDSDFLKNKVIDFKKFIELPEKESVISVRPKE